jgi:hypothetical protein
MLCRTNTGRFTANRDSVHLPQQQAGAAFHCSVTSGPDVPDLVNIITHPSIQMAGQATGVAVDFSLSNIMTELPMRLETRLLRLDSMN